jgi:tungstate transport system ATP-binding protein
MSKPVMYELREIHLQRNKSFCLHIPQLIVKATELLAIIGPTGAGKSSLLQLLTGLIPPHTGAIRFAEQGSYPWPLQVTRQIVFVPQQPKFLRGTVLQNIAYGLQIRQLSTSTAKLMDWLDKFQLADLGHQSAQTLSGGQSQLLALARAFIIPASVYLLDEPTANLDPASVACVEKIVREEMSERKLTIVLATHQWYQAQRLSQQTAVLIEGKLIEVNATEMLFEHAQQEQTRNFLHGKMVF